MNRNPRIQVPDGRDAFSVNRSETSDLIETDEQTGEHEHVAVAGDQRMADSSTQHQPKTPGHDEDLVQDTHDWKSSWPGEHQEVDKTGGEIGHVHNIKWPYYDNDRDVAGRDIRYTNHYYYGALADVDAKSIARRPSLLDEAALRRRVEVTVPPDGLAGYVDELKRERLVVLTCPSRRQEGTGCGQNSAAIWLLWHIIGDDSVSLKDPSVHKLHLDSVNGENENLLETLESSVSSTTFLIDLVDAPESQLGRVVEDLGNITKVLQESGAFLVVSAPESYHDEFGRNLPGRVCRLQPPDPVKVMRRNLSVFDASERERLLGDPGLLARLRRMWPAQVLQLAEWATTSHSQGKATEEVLNDLESAQQDWSKILNQVLDHDPDAWQRCLLLAAAVLEGADPSVVVESAWSLVEVTRFGLSRPHALQERSAKSELDFPASIPLDSEPVHFRAPGMAEAIPAHVWRHYRPLRGHIKHWLKSLPEQHRGLESRDLNSIVDSVAALARRNGHEIATGLAEAWICSGRKEGGRPYLMEPQRSMAVRLLSKCASDDELGFKVRECLYQWVYRRTDPSVAIVVAQVCATSYGALFPGSALTRLKHAARHEEPDVAAEVAKALSRIGEMVGITELTRHLATWGSHTHPHAVKVLLDTYCPLLERAETMWTQDRRATYALLVEVLTLWDELDKPHGSRASARLVRQWLRLVALASKNDGDTLMNMMVDKIGGNTRRVGHLYLALNSDPSSLESPRDRYDELKVELHHRFYETEAAQ